MLASSNRFANLSSAAALCLALGACAAPQAPSVGMLPGGGKNMNAFNVDDIACRQHAGSQSTSTSVASLGLGGGQVASARRGFSGSATGSMFGGSVEQGSGEPLTVQQRYDTAYIQCMFSKGHKVPVSGALTS